MLQTFNFAEVTTTSTTPFTTTPEATTTNVAGMTLNKYSKTLPLNKKSIDSIFGHFLNLDICF